MSDFWEPSPQQELDWAIHNDHADGNDPDHEPEITYESEVERRFQEMVGRGRVDGDSFITPSGAKIDAFKDEPDDDEPIATPCVYCQGAGDIEQEDEWRSLFMCHACNGTGDGGISVKGIERKQEWLDRIFFIDAPRFEMMDRDICPECGGGGCGGECQWTPEEWKRYTGEGEEDSGIFYAGPITTENIDEWVGAMESAFGEISKEVPF